MSEKDTLEYQMPSWIANDIIVPFQSATASVFLVHGNVGDLQANPDVAEEPDSPYISVRRFLEKFLDQYNIVVFYNLATGMVFPNADFEKEFRKVVEPPLDPADAKDPVAAAKAGMNAKRPLPQDPETCLQLMEKVLRTSERVAIVIDSIHSIAPASQGAALPQNERAIVERFRNWAKSESIRKSKNIVLLFTGELGQVSPELKQGDNRIKMVFMAKPGTEEREQFLATIENLKLDIKTLARASQGLSLWQIRELLLQTEKQKKELDLSFVKDKKREILNNEYGDVMELVEPVKGLEDIGGLDHIKDYFTGVLTAIKNGENRLTPAGVTICGPPGTGKTAVVEALAKEAGFNFVKSKNIRSMWVGQSEERMTKFIQGLRSLAPVVVMNDEADLAEAQRDAPKGDSGVSERLMKQFMELLSDPKIRGQIIVISITNRPDRIDAALKRSGRSDDRLLLPMPSTEERAAIFKVMFKRHDIPTTLKDFKAHAKMTEGFSGADLEKITLTSFRFAMQDGKKNVDENILTQAIEDFIPSASQAEIDRMTLMGILESSSRRLLPKHTKDILTGIVSRKLINGLDAYMKQVKERKIVDWEAPEKEGN